MARHEKVAQAAFFARFARRSSVDVVVKTKVLLRLFPL
jgi:hypothetical protein